MAIAILSSVNDRFNMHIDMLFTYLGTCTTICSYSRVGSRVKGYSLSIMGVRPSTSESGGKSVPSAQRGIRERRQKNQNHQLARANPIS